jgi:hypothetical protein
VTAGNFAASIRESIHAVEPGARVLAPTAHTLDPTLAKLGKAIERHPVLKGGFGKLYGFRSDEKGLTLAPARLAPLVD